MQEQNDEQKIHLENHSGEGVNRNQRDEVMRVQGVPILLVKFYLFNWIIF